MSDIDSTSVFEPVFELFDSSATGRESSPTFRMTALLHTEALDLSYEDQLSLKQLSLYRDYVNNIGDHIEVKLVIPFGTFVYDVYDYLDNIEVTIRTQKQYYKTTGVKDTVKPIVTTDRYKAVFLKDKNATIPNTKELSRDDLNQRLPLVVTLQLIDRSVEAIRIKTTGGSFSVTGSPRADDMIRNIFSKETSNILVDNRPPLDFIDIKTPDNPTSLNSITLPSFTRLIEIPDYIQEKSVGCYNAGLGCYIQKFAKDYDVFQRGFWVYPLYDPDKYTQDYLIYCPTEEARVVNYPGSVYDNKSLRILAHKVTIVDDDKEAEVMSSGTGFRIADASKMMTKPITVHEKGPIFERSRLNVEVVYKERKDGVNFAVNKGNFFNSFALTSSILKNQGKYMTLEISNLDHDVIAPNKTAMIKYVASDKSDNGKIEKKIRSRKGVPHQAVFVYSNNNPNMVTNATNPYVDMTSHATIKMFVGSIIPSTS